MDLLGLVQTDCEALADRLIALSTRPEVAQMMRADLPGVLKAMIAGAHTIGPAGMGERANLFRLTGLPTERPKDDKGGGAGRLANVADRLERALGMRAKVIEQVAGAEDATVAEDDAAEPASDLSFGE